MSRRLEEPALRISKIDGQVGLSILSKLKSSRVVDILTSKSSEYKVFYQEACRYWAKSSTFAPRFIRNGEAVDQPHGRTIGLSDTAPAGFVNCLLNSSLFYWYYSTLADCEHINDSLVRGFPLPADWSRTDWAALPEGIDGELRRSAVPKKIRTKQGHVIEYDEIDGKSARDVIIQADVALTRHFGLSDIEVDYLVNYDIKYRMGQGDDDA
ncbi:MAG: hypothetical protein V5B38_07420 [Candidatus Accumulibacter propinquus]